MLSDPPTTAIQVLVLMPMLHGYEAVRQTVATTVGDSKFELVWLEDLLEDWEWLDWLYTSVRQCDLVVANPSKHNAFIMYELGIARSHKHPTLIMLDREDSQLSGSLDGSPFLLYSNAELDDFSVRLRTDLSVLAVATMSHVSHPSDHVKFYRDAVWLLNRFSDETGHTVEKVEEDAFTARLNHSISHGTFFPALANTPLGNAALLAALIRSSRMVDTMAAIREWADLRVND